jgi:hypothetical protein
LYLAVICAIVALLTHLKQYPGKTAKKEDLPMSQIVVEQIVGRMLLDVEFRKQMTSDMDKALVGYELTPDELAGFRNMDLHDFHKTVSGLDERVSKGTTLN